MVHLTEIIGLKRMGLDEKSDVGIGVVYEQFMLNRLLARIVAKYAVKNALEAPIFGMAGLSGINSMDLTRLGADVTLVDTDEGRLSETKKAWKLAGRKARFVLAEHAESLPFKDSEFDLVLNFAALWHVRDPEMMLREMARVSSDIVLVCMPNQWNPMFMMRRLAGRLPAHHAWADIRRIKRSMEGCGFEAVETGLLDIPPWPDTVIPLKSVLSPLGIRKGDAWRWSMLDYYSGKNDKMKAEAEGFSFIEDSPLPGSIKLPWAHHRYAIFRKKRISD
jgi:SAM-dependent methyltransferase